MYVCNTFCIHFTLSIHWQGTNEIQMVVTFDKLTQNYVDIGNHIQEKLIRL
uniref:Uncharacterized protein n=1 Tax=Lepeophtheirus salmonis TaxID=72036 RepID=A0A0K2TEY1_LEPSM